jgi:hypothetical protein
VCHCVGVWTGGGIAECDYCLDDLKWDGFHPGRWWIELIVILELPLEAEV